MVMKRCAGLLLSLSIAAGTPAALPERVNAVEPTYEHTAAAAAGFTVTDRGTVDIVNAETITYTHDKTGAKVIHIANGDKNRSMFVSFETPALNDKGIPHVFEHATISGSENYPSPALFLSAARQTYNTGMNAFTFSGNTAYFFSSMSDVQLLAMTDYYMDCVFYPLLVRDELAFLRESWRYELESPEAELNVTGIVYNEVRAMNSIESAADTNLLKTLYPDSPASGNHGGDPDALLTVTHQETADFHEAYYHPSNATVFLYGDLDAEPFLEKIGAYCDRFDRKEIVLPEAGAEYAAGHVSKVYEFPAEASAPKENSGVIYYAIDLGKRSSDEFCDYGILTSLLQKSIDPLREELRAKAPELSVKIGLNFTTEGSYLCFLAREANESDMELLKSAADGWLRRIAEEGFDPGSLDDVLSQASYAHLSQADSGDMGLFISLRISQMSAAGMGYDYFNDEAESVERIRQEGAGYLQSLAAGAIAGNRRTVLSATIPAPGLREEMDAAFRAKLDGIKAAMSADEIAGLIALNQRLDAMSEEEAPEEALDAIAAVKADNLPAEIKTYDVKTEEVGGATFYTALADARGVGFADISLSSAGVGVDEIHYLQLYAALLGMMPTAGYSLDELSAAKSRYLKNFLIYPTSMDNFDGTASPFLTIQWRSVNEDWEEAVELVAEIVTNTNLSDAEAVKEQIERAMSSANNLINYAPDGAIAERVMSADSDHHAYTDYLLGADYERFLSRAAKELEEDPEGFTAKLEAVRGKVMTKDGAAIMFAGDAEGAETFRAAADGFLPCLSDEPVVPADLSKVPRYAGPEAAVIDSPVQYNMLYASYDSLGLSYNGKLPVMMSIVADKYLSPALRYRQGAYGAFAVAQRHGLSFSSYADPLIAETFETFKGAAGFAAGHGLTQEEIDRYILNCFSAENSPQGELSGAIRAVYDKLSGFPDGYKANVLEEIKSVTADDLTAFSEYLAKMAEQGHIITAGSQTAIEANRSLYEFVKTPSENIQ